MKALEYNELQSLRASQRANTVHVSLPPSAYYNLDQFQRVQKDILGRLGCLACCSGWDIRYDIQRQFTVDKDLNIPQFG